MTARHHFLGAHTVDNGGIDKAALRAGSAGMRSLQIFTAIPKYYGDRTSIRPERVERFRAALDAVEIEPRHVVSHAAYVLNVATAEEEKWARASAGLAKELERSTALGIGAVCFHPGAAKDGDREAAARRIGRALTNALKAVDGSGDGATRLLVENTAGAGMTMGRTPEEIAAILSFVPDELRPRTGYGLDSCHLYAAGYDIAESEAALAGVLDAFEAVIGEPPAFFHLNDSEGALGSNKDRHALIGEGAIGAEPFRWLLRDRRSARVPLILETPQRHPDIADDDTSADPYDLRMMELLRGME
ncbi:MAG TPA: deoxyribonuclease IV [Gemmatimonadaceae bacterium]|nr:deoxyribonuclease IV [Gemmatimonadaceae bacterium]